MFCSPVSGNIYSYSYSLYKKIMNNFFPLDWKTAENFAILIDQLAVRELHSSGGAGSAPLGRLRLK